MLEEKGITLVMLNWFGSFENKKQKTVQQCFRSAMLDCWTVFFLKNLVPTLPAMQLSHCVTSPEAVYQIKSSFLWSHKKLFTTFFTSPLQLCSPRKHTKVG